VARALDIEVTEPRRMSELNVDLTETRPIERRVDSVLRAELILERLAAALDTTDTGIAANLAGFTEAGLGDTPGLQIWRALMAAETFPFVSEMRAKGRAEGEAKAVLQILKRRKVAVDGTSQQRIESCTNVRTLETWLDRSLAATTVEELFQD
jgi:hypothetical protein